MTIKAYGENGISESELIKCFGDYIVRTYTSRPQIQIGGYRIPIISRLLEWSVHATRKGLIRFFLERSQLVDTILTQGTGSAKYAQLGLKKMLLAKLQEIDKIIQRSRPREVSDLTNVEDPSRLRLEAKKARLITGNRDLHHVMQQHSRNLHRFIQIQACNNMDESLHNIDGRINSITSEVLSSVHHLFQWQPVTYHGVLEDATTNLLETALLSLFEDKERQIEMQMQGVFQVLERTYDYTPPERQIAQEYRLHEDLENVDRQLNQLLNQLSRLAIEEAVEDHLKNASVKRHRQIEEFVEREKKEMIEFSSYLYHLNPTLTAMINDQDVTIQKVKEKVNEAVSRIEGFLTRTLATLDRNELKAVCYSDVRGDLHNAYAIQIKMLENFARETLDPLLNKIQAVEQQEQQLLHYQEACERLEDPDNVFLQDELEKELREIQLLIPETYRDSFDETFRIIRENWQECDRINGQLRLADQEEQLRKQQEAYSLQLKQLDAVHKKLEELSRLLTQYRNLRGVDAVRKKQLQEQIEQIYISLMQVNDSSLREHVLEQIRSNDNKELYNILHPRLRFRSEVPVFSALNRYRLLLQKEMEIIKNQREDLMHQIDGLNIEEIQQDKSRLIHETGQKVLEVKDAIEKMSQDSVELLYGMLMQLVQLTKNFESIGNETSILSDYLKVDGYIAVGELKLAQNIGPVAATIAPRISESITHLLDSLGKPFHYKQLILRLVMLDTVRRSEAS